MKQSPQRKREFRGVGASQRELALLDQIAARTGAASRTGIVRQLIEREAQALGLPIPPLAKRGRPPRVRSTSGADVVGELP
jgi:hypothetical protein